MNATTTPRKQWHRATDQAAPNPEMLEWSLVASTSADHVTVRLRVWSRSGIFPMRSVVISPDALQNWIATLQAAATKLCPTGGGQ